MTEVITALSRETFAFAKKFAENLKGGEVIALSGELGAGKTIFAQGLAAGLGIKKNVNSPTFVVMKIYKNKNGKNLVHIDAYRLQDERDLMNIGAQEYFLNKNYIVIIEWPERVEKILPKETIKIDIKNLKEENQRKIKY